MHNPHSEPMQAELRVKALHSFLFLVKRSYKHAVFSNGKKKRPVLPSCVSKADSDINKYVEKNVEKPADRK